MAAVYGMCEMEVSADVFLNFGTTQLHLEIHESNYCLLHLEVRESNDCLESKELAFFLSRLCLNDAFLLSIDNTWKTFFSVAYLIKTRHTIDIIF